MFVCDIIELHTHTHVRTYMSAGVQSDSPSVQYGALCAFLHQIASVDPNSSTARMQNIPPYTSRNISSNNTPEPSHFVGQIRRERAHLQTCPSRLVITKTVKRNPSLTPLRPPGGFGTRELSEAEKGILSRETARLLVKIEYVLREHNWGNSVQMKRFEQALASKDRERTGYLDVDEVRDLIYVHRYVCMYSEFSLICQTF